MTASSKLLVEAIKSGTVIDHIPAGQGIRILTRLRLAESPDSITVGLNLRSKEQGLKDIIKVENRHFSEQEASELMIFAPNATMNVIENYVVTKKFKLALPSVLEGAFDCPNSNCISHSEPVKSAFLVREQDGDVRLKCKYCEKVFHKSIIADIA